MEAGLQWLPEHTDDLENICVQVKQKKQKWLRCSRIYKESSSPSRITIGGLIQPCRPANAGARSSLSEHSWFTFQQDSRLTRAAFVVGDDEARVLKGPPLGEGCFRSVTPSVARSWETLVSLVKLFTQYGQNKTFSFGKRLHDDLHSRYINSTKQK